MKEQKRLLEILLLLPFLTKNKAYGNYTFCQCDKTTSQSLALTKEKMNLKNPKW